MIRDSLDVRQLAWIRPLVGAYAHDFQSVAPLFAGNPADASAWRETIARVQRAPRDRGAIAAVLDAQQERRGAPEAARQAARTLADPQSVAIVTGQQAGLFGGPLYTLLKAVTTIQLAAKVRQEHGTPVVPVFWVDAEDHDWDEVRTAHILDAAFALKDVVLSNVAGAGERPIARLLLDDGIHDAMAELESTLQPTEFTGELLGALRAHYRPGVTMAQAFASWIEQLLGLHGLVVFESSDPAAKPLVADLFAREIERPGRTAELAREAGALMTRLGHHAQLEPDADAVSLFYMDDLGRHAIKRRDGAFVVRDAVRPADALSEEIRTRPEQFSPNVLLRPIVQDRLLPTACYVAGPSELAYQAQLGAIYRECGVEAPLLYPRASLTIVDAAAARFLDRQNVPLAMLQAQDDSALNLLLEGQWPPELDRTFDEFNGDIARRAGELKAAVPQVDPTLSGTVNTTADRMRDALKTLHHKIVQATKRKDDTLRRQFNRTRALAFPDGTPQERVLSLAFFLNRYGLSLGDRLVELVPVEMGAHYVLVL